MFRHQDRHNARRNKLVGLDLTKYVPSPDDILKVVVLGGVHSGKERIFRVGTAEEIHEGGIFGVRLDPAGAGFPYPMWVKIKPECDLLAQTDPQGHELGASYRIVKINDDLVAA